MQWRREQGRGNMNTNSYQIRVKGEVDARWFDWFVGLEITHTPTGDTIITGAALDQAALHAILDRIRDLGLELIAVQRAPAAERPSARKRRTPPCLLL
jgi:hypothetical protein